MIFITGDTHGEFERFSSKQIKQLKIGDTLIILGDFGFVWNNDKAEMKVLKKISKLNFQVLFIDGHNENMSAISSYPEVMYHGAAAREIYKKKIYYIKRGEILELEGKKIMCFGGADFSDPDFKFKPSIPGQAEFESCVENFRRHQNKVDYILTHLPSGKINRFINLNSYHTSGLLEFFDTVTDKVEYTRWYFGSVHQDKYITSKAHAVYCNTIQLKD